MHDETLALVPQPRSLLRETGVFAFTAETSIQAAAGLQVRGASVVPICCVRRRVCRCRWKEDADCNELSAG